MIHFEAEMAYYDKHMKRESLRTVQHYLNELKDQLMHFEQYEEVCHVYLLKMTHYYWAGQTLRALQLYLQNRPFIEQYATNEEHVALRYASCLLLDTLGFYQNNMDAMLELKEEAEKLQLHDVKLDTLNNLGYYCELAQNFEEAKRYYEACIAFYHEQPAIQKSISHFLALLNIAHVYLKEQNAEMAQYYLAQYEEANIPDLFMTELIYRARQVRLHVVIGDFARAAEEAERYLAFDLEQTEYHLVLGHLQFIASMYAEMNEEAKQIDVLERALRYADKLNGQAVRQYSISLVQAMQQHEQLHELKYDALTGALTRKSFEQYVKPLLAMRPQLLKVFLLIDVDYFKQVNDQHGHVVGDAFLKDIATRAISYTNEQLPRKVLCGRYGGDEFYVFFEAASTTQAEHIVRHFHATITQEPFMYDKLKLRMSVTIGATYSLSTTHTFNDWFEEADKLLYAAKKRQRGICYVQRWGNDCHNMYY